MITVTAIASIRGQDYLQNLQNQLIVVAQQQQAYYTQLVNSGVDNTIVSNSLEAFNDQISAIQSQMVAAQQNMAAAG